MPGLEPDSACECESEMEFGVFFDNTRYEMCFSQSGLLGREKHRETG